MQGGCIALNDRTVWRGKQRALVIARLAASLGCGTASAKRGEAGSAELPGVPGYAQEVALLEIGYSRLERLENEAPLVRVRAAPSP